MHAQLVGLVHEARVAARLVRPRHPQVVALEQVARLGNVAGVNRELAAVIHVAEADVHAALGRLGHAALLADLLVILTLAVGVQLGDAVVVGQIEVRVAAAGQVGGADGQRPARAADAHLLGHVLEGAVALVAQQVLAAAVLGKLEVLRHDARRLQVPQVHVVGPVAGDEQVELAVAVEVQPGRAIGVDPRR